MKPDLDETKGVVMRPVLGLTIGDPAGVGPEIAVRVAAMEEVRTLCRLVLIGDMCVVERAFSSMKKVGGSGEGGPEVVSIPANLSTTSRADCIEVVDTGILSIPPEHGRVSKEGGMASYEAIKLSINLAINKSIDGVVTAPINKKTLQLAGIKFPGHTEMFGEFTNSPKYAMMMYSERMAVGLVTCHQSLVSVSGSLTTERVVEVGELLAASVKKIRGKAPRMAVLGLNPHAGEEGLFGDEEGRVIVPAVARLRAMGVDVEGPIPPDTAFTKRALSRYDAHLCMYHDQGLIPFKMLCFEDGVNVTMGLPFPRTSVDHGTAYDLAGKGTAEIGSMMEAIRLAAKLVEG